MFSDWKIKHTLMGNLRYSGLIDIPCAMEYVRCKEFPITLGQGLLLPLFLISMGVMIARSIISDCVVKKYFHFLE